MTRITFSTMPVPLAMHKMGIMISILLNHNRTRPA
jgi:hypothetical protein